MERTVTREHFRGVIWPREPVDANAAEGKVLTHRYVVVGILITDRPLDVDPNQTAVDGPVSGIACALEQARRVELRHKVGDATDVLLSLETAWPPKT